ncbi:MAG: xanthine dehydrogenase family protein molybdopterin-binding subunit [Burkholderiales bacterium]|nr:xanthine dehydrogenase family protein molybdopterin-binding subunit [Burkholderiales bacterium]
MAAAFKGRREDRRLVSGGGRYTADWNLPGQLHAAFLRSDRPHARIVAIDAQAALAAPGVVAVLTGEDTLAEGIRNAPPMLPYPGRGGQPIKLPPRSVLATGRVSHIGQEVAMVVATTALAAADAVERISIEYSDLPAVIDAEAALAPGAPLAHPEVPGNVCFDFDYGDEARVKEIFAGAARITRVKLDSQRICGVPMEPKACLASYDAQQGVYDFWSSTQGITMMRGSVAGYGIAPDKVRPRAQDVGGGFGIRSGAYPEYIAVMIAAKKTGRPVKWVGSRSETFVSDHHGRAIRLSGELAMDEDGHFLAARYEWVCNQGAFPSGPGPLINTVTPKLTPNGVYRIPAVYGRNRLVLTNTTPITAYRGAGRPDAAYLLERLVEEAARESGIDRVELRRRNLIPKDAFPYTTPTQSAYDSGDYEALLDEVLARSDWEGFEARRAEARARGRLRGIGCAVFLEPAGGAGPKDQAMLKFGSSGEMTLYSVTGPSGQGHETVFPEVVGRELGVPPELITLRASDPDGPPLDGFGTVGSRSMGAHGGAALLAAREVVRKGLELAAKELEVAAQDLEFAGGRFRVKGTDRSLALVELARRHAGKGAVHPLDATADNAAGATFPSGAHVAEVEIDPRTGAVEVARYTGVDDCGVVVNHTLVEGQVQGGIVQGAGQVLGEHCVFDEGGQLLTGSFMDYAMPHAGLIGELRLYDHPVPSPRNPLGVKGVGESGTTGSLPTLMNAILDALRPAGVRQLDMPATPARVWAALRAAAGARQPPRG